MSSSLACVTSAICFISILLHPVISSRASPSGYAVVSEGEKGACGSGNSCSCEQKRGALYNPGSKLKLVRCACFDRGDLLSLRWAETWEAVEINRCSGLNSACALVLRHCCVRFPMWLPSRACVISWRCIWLPSTGLVERFETSTIDCSCG